MATLAVIMPSSSMGCSVPLACGDPGPLTCRQASHGDGLTETFGTGGRQQCCTASTCAPSSGLGKIVVHRCPDGTSPSRLGDVIRASLATGVPHLIVDLRGLPSIDIHFAAELSRAGRVLAAQQGSWRIVATRADVASTLTTFGMSSRVGLFRSIREAGWPARTTSRRASSMPVVEPRAST